MRRRRPVDCCRHVRSRALLVVRFGSRFVAVRGRRGAAGRAHASPHAVDLARRSEGSRGHALAAPAGGRDGARSHPGGRAAGAGPRSSRGNGAVRVARPGFGLAPRRAGASIPDRRRSRPARARARPRDAQNHLRALSSNRRRRSRARFQGDVRMGRGGTPAPGGSAGLRLLARRPVAGCAADARGGRLGLRRRRAGGGRRRAPVRRDRAALGIDGASLVAGRRVAPRLAASLPHRRAERLVGGPRARTHGRAALPPQSRARSGRGAGRRGLGPRPRHRKHRADDRRGSRGGAAVPAPLPGAEPVRPARLGQDRCGRAVRDRRAELRCLHAARGAEWRVRAGRRRLAAGGDPRLLPPGRGARRDDLDVEGAGESRGARRLLLRQPRPRRRARSRRRAGSRPSGSPDRPGHRRADRPAESVQCVVGRGSAVLPPGERLLRLLRADRRGGLPRVRARGRPGPLRRVRHSALFR